MPKARDRTAGSTRSERAKGSEDGGAARSSIRAPRLEFEEHPGVRPGILAEASSGLHRLDADRRTGRGAVREGEIELGRSGAVRMSPRSHPQGYGPFISTPFASKRSSTIRRHDSRLVVRR